MVFHPQLGFWQAHFIKMTQREEEIHPSAVRPGTGSLNVQVRIGTLQQLGDENTVIGIVSFAKNEQDVSDMGIFLENRLSAAKGRSVHELSFTGSCFLHGFLFQISGCLAGADKPGLLRREFWLVLHEFSFL